MTAGEMFGWAFFGLCTIGCICMAGVFVSFSVFLITKIGKEITKNVREINKM